MGEYVYCVCLFVMLTVKIFKNYLKTFKNNLFKPELEYSKCGSAQPDKLHN